MGLLYNTASTDDVNSASHRDVGLTNISKESFSSRFENHLRKYPSVQVNLFSLSAYPIAIEVLPHVKVIPERMRARAADIQQKLSSIEGLFYISWITFFAKKCTPVSNYYSTIRSEFHNTTQMLCSVLLQ